MIESLKALFVVGVLSVAAFTYARIAFGGAVAPSTIDRWRNVFIAVTVVTFLVPNYWLMLAVMSATVIMLGASEKFRPALYLLLLFAAPAASRIVPGFGGINNFLELYPFNVLAILILFPLLLHPSETKGSRTGFLADAFFIAYALVVFALCFRDTTFTDGMRRATAFLMTAIPQYFVFSRIRWTIERVRLATAALVIPLLALAAVAVAEVVLGWHVYANAVQTWDVSATLRYIERSGFLRAYGSVFGPIAFGLFLVVGLALTPALMASATSKRFAALSIPAMSAGLLATFSRGPWVGGALAIAAYVATTRRSMTNLAKLGAAGLAGLAVLSVTPFGGMVFSLLPFIGDVEENTIDYRQRLLEVGWAVVKQNPFFGSEGYMQTPAMQSLVQGQGIIDIVNAYLRIALDSGLVGLSLYLGAVGFSLLAALRAIAPSRRFDPEFSSYCQAYFAALLGLSVVLATTANTIAQVQEVTWAICGICVGLARSAALSRREAEMAPAAVAVDDQATIAGEPEPDPPPSRPLPPHLRQYQRR